MKREYEGFYSNKVSLKRIFTAMNGEFRHGYTALPVSALTNDKTEGSDGLMDCNIKALRPFAESLNDGSIVNVYMSWNLSDDKTEYQDVDVVKVEIEKAQKNTGE